MKTKLLCLYIYRIFLLPIYASAIPTIHHAGLHHHHHHHPSSPIWNLQPTSISKIQNNDNRFQRMRTGMGKYRMLPGGNAEISCEFPNDMLMISNIVWERVDMGTQDLNMLYRRYGITHQYDVHSRPHGSTLYLFDVTPLDWGVYRCLTTALDPITNQLVIHFQDTVFGSEVNNQNTDSNYH